MNIRFLSQHKKSMYTWWGCIRGVVHVTVRNLKYRSAISCTSEPLLDLPQFILSYLSRGLHYTATSATFCNFLQCRFKCASFRRSWRPTTKCVYHRLLHNQTHLNVIQFSNLCGTVYRQGNVLFTADGNSLLSPVGNRVTVFDLVKWVYFLRGCSQLTQYW